MKFDIRALAPIHEGMPIVLLASVEGMSGLSTNEAEAMAYRLVHQLGQRWAHVQAVAGSGEEICDVIGLEADVLVSAAWLHDIGYAPELEGTGFHPVDGARYLREQGFDERVVSLVAHHSCARFEAEVRGLGDVLSVEFPRPDGEYEDAPLLLRHDERARRGSRGRNRPVGRDPGTLRTRVARHTVC
jgi:putative nucleotidyltransferase with HDIG domain